MKWQGRTMRRLNIPARIWLSVAVFIVGYMLSAMRHNKAQPKSNQRSGEW